jgi:hypothetical protein
MDWTGRRNWALYALMVHLPCWGRNLALELWYRWWAPQVVVIHCFLHRHALASKTLSPRLKSAVDTVVQAVNFIRSRSLNHRIFKIFCQEVGAAHELLLYRTEVRWLSHGRVFTRVMEFRTKIAMFLREKENKLCEDFETQGFIVSLAYLADIFSHLNDLNISHQGQK